MRYGITQFNNGAHAAKRKDWRVKPNENSFKEEIDHKLVTELLIADCNDRPYVSGITSGESSGQTLDNVVLGNARLIRKEGSAAWRNKHVMSLDGLVRPANTFGSGESCNRYFEPISGCSSGQIVGAQPPIEYEGTSQYSVIIGRDYLNPFVNPDFDHHGSQSGHDIDIVARHSSLCDFDDYHESLAIEESNGYNPYRENYRHVAALRGPLIVKGWGYTTQGKPVPNSIDSLDAMMSGTYSGEGQTDEFFSGWTKNSNTWPVAPVDLRLDMERGVWVSPPTHGMICIETKEAISAGSSGNAFQTEGDILYDVSGQVIPFTTGNNIVIKNKTNADIGSGESGIAYFKIGRDNCEYWLMAGGSGGSDPTGDCCTGLYCPSGLRRGGIYQGCITGSGAIDEGETYTIEIKPDGMTKNFTASNDIIGGEDRSVLLFVTEDCECKVLIADLDCEEPDPEPCDTACMIFTEYTSNDGTQPPNTNCGANPQANACLTVSNTTTQICDGDQITLTGEITNLTAAVYDFTLAGQPAILSLDGGTATVTFDSSNIVPDGFATPTSPFWNFSVPAFGTVTYTATFTIVDTDCPAGGVGAPPTAGFIAGPDTGAMGDFVCRTCPIITP